MRLPSYEIDHALGELRAAAEDPDELRLRPLLELALAVVRGDPTIDHHRLVDGATPYLSASGFAVAACVSNIEHRLTCTFYSDEWVHVCVARSRVEALRTLWPGVSASLSPLFLDTEVADDMLRQKGAHEGWLRDGEIPSGTPVSHFWWWLPREPPGYAAVVREAALRALKDAPRSAAPEHAIRPFLDYAFRLVRGELRDDAARARRGDARARRAPDDDVLRSGMGRCVHTTLVPRGRAHGVGLTARRARGTPARLRDGRRPHAPKGDARGRVERRRNSARDPTITLLVVARHELSDATIPP